MIGQLTFDKILGRACLLQLICKSKKGKWGSTKTKQNITLPFFTLKAKHMIVQLLRPIRHQPWYRLRRFTLLLPGVIHHWPSSRTPRIQSRPFFCHPQCFIHEGVFLDPRAPLFVSFCRGARRGEAVRRSYRDNRCHQSHHDHHHQGEQNHDHYHLWL